MTLQKKLNFMIQEMCMIGLNFMWFQEIWQRRIEKRKEEKRREEKGRGRERRVTKRTKNFSLELYMQFYYLKILEGKLVYFMLNPLAH